MTNEQSKDVWISVGELADSFLPDAYVLPSVDDLDGRHIVLIDSAERRIECHFRLRNVDVDFGLGSKPMAYETTSPRDGIYLVDITDATVPGLSIVFILDLKTGTATIVEAKLPEPDALEEPLFRRARRGLPLTSVNSSIVAAFIDNSYGLLAAQHGPTTDLVGLRLRHRYSSAECYEHIYLNEQRYCWHCLEGSEKGLADVEECNFWRIADNLYLFAWREKLIPTFGVVLMDLDALRTTGKIMGFRDDTFGAVSHFRIGALSQIVNRVSPVLDPAFAAPGC